MPPDSTPSRLSQISTAWTLLFQAHVGTDDQIGQARRELLHRYSRPIHRYLLAATRDEHAADELYQEFALRLVRGAFERAHPDRGRFREFVKRALYNLVVDHHRALRRRPELLGEAAAGLADDSGDSAQLDAEFVAGWRAELLERAWDSLAADERRGGQPYHAVLKLRTEQPVWPSQQLAAELSTRLGRAVDAAWVRKNLQRARERFSDSLIAEVARGLESADPQLVADDLEELGLLEFCREALGRLANRGQARIHKS